MAGRRLSGESSISEPITTQPTSAGTWMVAPHQAHTNCPPGLEYLTLIDQLLVKQQVQVIEALSGYGSSNKYQIVNSKGHKIYYAVELSTCFTRNCGGSLRPFDMKILDNLENEVMHINRPLACDCCICPCCLQSLQVFAPPGELVGRVHQSWTILVPSFIVENSNGDAIYKITGPAFTCSIQGDVEFKILSPNGKTQVGKISKQWAAGKERMLEADSTLVGTFGITFPGDLDVRMKAVMLGACFLIDFIYFENIAVQQTTTGNVTNS